MAAVTPDLLDPLPVVLRAVPFRIDPDEVRAFQAYKPLLPLSPEAAAGLSAARREAENAARPGLVYRTLPIAAAEPDRLVLAGGSEFHIPDIGRHWGAIDAVAVGLATVGDELPRRVSARRAAGDTVGATLLDSAASAAVECVAEWANDHLCRLGVARGLRVTNRISPGLAGWDLGEQRRLVGLCPAAEIGVRVRPDGGLAPAKTISFLVGIGRAARVDHYFVQCRRCWVPDCPARRMPAAGSVQRDTLQG